MSFQIGDTVGDYQIIELLGAGGMGKVYKVKNQISDRIDALKVLLPDLADNPDLADRFTREIKVLASLNHPNIAGLRTAFRLENQLLMVMEYVEGVPLDKRTKEGPIPVDEAVDYICQALAALGYAHQRGVIHRDIKPANMMLTPDGLIKLMDFGIAKSKTDRKLTQTGTTMGSLFYMSPEQVRGTGLDGRSDLYSVGVSLYEMVVGSRPFQGDSDFDIMIAQLQQNPVAPIEKAPGLPQALNDAIMTSLSKDPANRFQTAEAFSEALGQPVSELGPTRLHTSNRVSVTSTPDTPKSPPEPAPLQPETPTARKPSIIKYLVPALVAVALITSVVLFLTHGHKAPQNAAVPAKPNRPALLRSTSGDMVYVDGGEALLGKSLTRAFVKSFYIDKTEATNHAFLDFCRATGRTAPKGADQSKGDYPVVNVSLEEARSFCGWAGKRLPTAEEWEKAARGPNGQLFPWGSDFNSSLANVPLDDSAARTAKLEPAESCESGKSPYGALNMLGNAFEWVDAVAPTPPAQEFRTYQQYFRDLVPPLSATEPFYHARGGSYKFPHHNPAELISDPGSPLPARARKPDVGFRCAMDVKD